MKRHFLVPPHPIKALILGFAVFSLPVSTSLQAQEIQVGRYSVKTAMATPAQTDLLSTDVTIQFPDRIHRVGEAIRYLLQRSGYRLVQADALSPETISLFALPLPAVHRTFGPITLRDVLKTLVGPAFILVEDPVHRLITFERSDRRQAMQRMGKAQRDEEVGQHGK